MTAAVRAGVSVATRVTIRTTSAAATRSLAAWIAAVAAPGDRIALLGPLGAGKTQFAMPTCMDSWRLDMTEPRAFVW